MPLLCFLLDLRHIPPPLLRLLQQCLLQLANLFAVHSSSAVDEDRCGGGSGRWLRDRIALCYIEQDRSISSSPELKIAYKPGEKFSLCDFHHSVNYLPQDSFEHEHNGMMHVGSIKQDAPLSTLFCGKALYSWVCDDVSKKVITISFSVENIDDLRKILMDAADECVSVEFVYFDDGTSTASAEVSTDDNKFIDKIGDLENCLIRRYKPDSSVLHRLVKQWLQELMCNTEEPLQAIFAFRTEVVNSVDRIRCNLHPCSIQMVDYLHSCEACMCPGHPTGTPIVSTRHSCSISRRGLASSNIIDNAVRVGENNILFLPSSQGASDPQRLSMPIMVNVVERTSLASLNEGVIMGASFIVTPCSQDVEATLSNDADQNTHIFHAICESLYQLDQGLICSSTCNPATLKTDIFQCYFVLQPSEKGPMLLRL